MTRRLLPLLTALLLAHGAALAVQPDEMLADPALEHRAREISAGLRCVVCQNESIDASNAELAHDMRLLVRQRLLAGDSNAAVQQFMVDRYGDYVLLKPPFKAKTYVLWFGPFALLALALVVGWRFYRRPAGPAAAAPPAQRPLTTEEQRRLDRLLKDDGADR
jgi:cytochrome c-type biogenesis protein CcmH